MLFPLALIVAATTDERVAIWTALGLAAAAGVAAVPALISALSSFRKTSGEVQTLHEKIGEPNGAGSITQMVQKSIDVSQRQLEATARVSDRIDRHGEKLRDVDRKIEGLDERLEGLDERLRAVEAADASRAETLGEIVSKVDQTGEQLTEVNLRLGDVEHVVQERTEIARLHAGGRLQERAGDPPNQE